MDPKTFFKTIETELSATCFLIESRVFPDEDELPKCLKCNSSMKYFIKKSGNDQKIKARCSRCFSAKSITNYNSFFCNNESENCRVSGLNITKILHIIYEWTDDSSVIEAMGHCKASKPTIIHWYQRCRRLLAKQWENRSKMGGQNRLVQIDECLLRGKRKNNVGRLRLGDLNAARVEDASINSSRNYGRRLEGPWVFGLVEKLDDGALDARFFVVEKRDAATLESIITREVEIGSTIHSDEWRGYLNIWDYGYHHDTVNHTVNFINPETGANTQRIESLWTGLRLKIVKQMRGTINLEDHLIERSWRLRRKNDDLFESFIKILGECKQCEH